MIVTDNLEYMINLLPRQISIKTMETDFHLRTMELGIWKTQMGTVCAGYGSFDLTNKKRSVYEVFIMFESKSLKLCLLKLISYLQKHNIAINQDSVIAKKELAIDTRKKGTFRATPQVFKKTTANFIQLLLFDFEGV